MYPWWLVVEDRDGKINGMIQVCPATPIGRMEIMCIDVTLHTRLRSIVARALLDQGLATLRMAGCQGASGVIPFEQKSYKKIVKRHGWRVAVSGNLMIKRLI